MLSFIIVSLSHVFSRSQAIVKLQRRDRVFTNHQHHLYTPEWLKGDSRECITVKEELAVVMTAKAEVKETEILNESI